MAHQVVENFGATYCSPQGVMLRSGGIGLTFSAHSGLGFLVPLSLGIGSVRRYPRTSVIADSIFGGALPEICITTTDSPTGVAGGVQDRGRPG